MDPLRPHLITDADTIDADLMARIEADLSVRLQGVMTEPRIDYRPMAEEHYDHTIRLHDSVAPGTDGLNAHREG